MLQNDHEMALHATRSAWKVMKEPRWSSQDWEDLTQEAALEIWRVTPLAADKSNPTAFVFYCARRAVMKHYVRNITARNPASTVALDWSNTEILEPDTESGRSLNQETLDFLVQTFQRTRKQKAGRAVAASHRDAQIVDLLVRGYRNHSIALELDTSAENVKTYRKQIHRQLKTLAIRGTMMRDNAPLPVSRPAGEAEQTGFPRRPTEDAADIY